jgi:hypothetical protein
VIERVRLTQEKGGDALKYASPPQYEKTAAALRRRSLTSVVGAYRVPVFCWSCFFRSS